MIHFLDDSHHYIKGQIVEIPDLPDWIIEDAMKERNEGR